MKNELKLDIEIKELKLEKETTQERIWKINESLRNLYEEKTKFVLRRNNSKENIKNILNEFELMIKILNKKGYPNERICNHFGVWGRCNDWTISISDSDMKQDRIMVILEIKEWVGNKEVGASKKSFNLIKKEFGKKYKIIDSWNGEERNTSISLILNKKIPKKFLESLLAYRNRKDVFSGKTTNNFGRKFDREYKKMKAKL